MEDRIGTLRDVSGHDVGAAELVAVIHRARRQSFPLPRGVSEGPAMLAEVNHGRWLVQCPFCAGAELADPGEPVFYCLSCYCAAGGGAWLRVLFPANREAIEEELLKRPREANRNWLPGETVADLRLERAAAARALTPGPSPSEDGEGGRR